METVSITNGEGSDEFSPRPGYDQKTAAAFGLPRQRVHQGGVFFKQGLEVKQGGAKIEDGVSLATSEIVNRTRVLNRHRFSISQSLSPKTVEIEFWCLGGKEDSKVEHLS